MEEYTNLLKEYLDKDRNWTKNVFKIMGTIYRGVKKDRFTYEQGIKAIERLGGAN